VCLSLHCFLVGVRGCCDVLCTLLSLRFVSFRFCYCFTTALLISFVLCEVRVRVLGCCFPIIVCVVCVDLRTLPESCLLLRCTLCGDRADEQR